MSNETIPTEKVALVFNPQQVHKSVRNYLINECDVSKEKIDNLVRELVDEKVENILKHYILNSRFFENMVEQTIMKLVKQGVQAGAWYDPNTPFTSFVKNQVSKAIERDVLNKYDISIKENNNDN